MDTNKSPTDGPIKIKPSIYHETSVKPNFKNSTNPQDVILVFEQYLLKNLNFFQKKT